MDEKARLGTSRRHLLRNLVERELSELEGAEHEPKDEKRGRQRARHDDLEVAEPVETERLASDHDRPVSGADARAVGQERVVVLDERIRRERDRRDLEPARTRPLVERLDVAEHLLELVPARVDEVRRERPVHERVVGIGTVSDANPQGAGR